MVDQTEMVSGYSLTGDDSESDRGDSPARVTPGANDPVRGAKSVHPDFFQGRLQSLDAYRGLIMITLSFAGFGLAKTAQNFMDTNESSAVWESIRFHFTHVEWVGCSYWDMIQPSFMFMVGVSMPFSYAKRQQRGESFRSRLSHSVIRSLVLILLGIFLTSNWSRTTNWSFMNVLAQMGLGYTFAFLFLGRRLPIQLVGSLVILLSTWLLFSCYPSAGIDVDEGRPAVGVSAEWAQANLRGLAPEWHKNANIGHRIDRWLLNQLPRENPFEFNRGGYQTINFLPSLATMLFGLMSGEWLRRNLPGVTKFLGLAVAGALLWAVGFGLHEAGVCPLVKRIWTPSWAVFSTGICCWILAGFYLVIDVLGLRFWAYPLRVVGTNSMAVYCMSMLLKPWVAQTYQTHFGGKVFEGKLQFGETTVNLIDSSHQLQAELWAPTTQAILVGMAFWLVCLWLYRNRVFLRI